MCQMVEYQFYLLVITIGRVLLIRIKNIFLYFLGLESDNSNLLKIYPSILSFPVPKRGKISTKQFHP
jgi:hypothetical protein